MLYIFENFPGHAGESPFLRKNIFSDFCLKNRLFIFFIKSDLIAWSELLLFSADRHFFKAPPTCAEIMHHERKDKDGNKANDKKQRILQRTSLFQVNRQPSAKTPRKGEQPAFSSGKLLSKKNKKRKGYPFLSSLDNIEIFIYSETTVSETVSETSPSSST